MVSVFEGSVFKSFLNNFNNDEIYIKKSLKIDKQLTKYDYKT